MSSLLEKVKDKLSSHSSDNKTEQPEGTHGPHSSRTANAADPRIDSDRDHREALGRHEGTYTAVGDNYSYGESKTKGTNTAGDTLTSSSTTGPAPTTAGMHKSDMFNKVDPRIDSDLDGSKNMGLRSEKATHAGTTSTSHGTGTTSTSHGTGTTSSAYGTGTTTTGSSIGSSGTGTAFGSTGPASKTAGTHKSDTLNKADPRIDSDLDGSRNMGLRSEKQTYDTGATSGYGVGTTTTSTGNTYSSTEPSYTAGVHKSDALNKADPRIDSDLDGSRNMGLRSEQATHGTTRTAGTTGTSFGTGMGTDTFGAGSGINTSGRSGDYTSGTSGLEGRGSGTDTYSGMGKTSGLGSGTGTGAYSGMDTTSGYDSSNLGSSNLGSSNLGSSNLGSSNLGSSNLGSSNLGSSNLGSSNLGSGERSFGQQTGTLGSDTTTSAYGGLGSTGPASNTAGPHKSDMLNKADPRVDSDLDNSKTFGGNKTYQS